MLAAWYKRATSAGGILARVFRAMLDVELWTWDGVSSPPGWFPSGSIRIPPVDSKSGFRRSPPHAPPGARGAVHSVHEVETGTARHQAPLSHRYPSRTDHRDCWRSGLPWASVEVVLSGGWTVKSRIGFFMDTPRSIALSVALITGSFTLAGVVFTFLVAILAHRRETRKLRHDETRWLLELQCDIERKLLEMRLETYAEVFSGLKDLSHYPPKQRSRADWLALAETVNGWGYSKASIVMLPDTRAEIFTLRERLRELADGKIDAEAMMAGSRTTLTELLRRDLNQTESVWRDNLPSLFSKIIEAVDRAQPKPQETGGRRFLLSILSWRRFRRDTD
jgi:hypothetical protein